RRHTRFSRDWSSDVCSSDLRCIGMLLAGEASGEVDDRGEAVRDDDVLVVLNAGTAPLDFRLPPGCWIKVLDTYEHDVCEGPCGEIGRASCRERGWSAGVGDT